MVTQPSGFKIARGDPGLRGYEVTNWLGLVAPAATPRSVVNTIHAAVVASAADAALRTLMVAFWDALPA